MLQSPFKQENNMMGFIGMAVVGFIAGLLARAIMPGEQKMGFILTAVLGIVGSYAAGFIGQALGFYTAGQGAGFIGSVVGAIIVLAIYSFVMKAKGGSTGGDAGGQA
jgi:uncharacterized membrane protein YeaQ/YmgE (transglycosylase-associated protein family)